MVMIVDDVENLNGSGHLNYMQASLYDRPCRLLSLPTKPTNHKAYIMQYEYLCLPHADIHK